MAKALTKDAINDLEPKEKAYEVRDDELKGYLARVQPTGRITFYVEYRTAEGVRARVKLGTYPKLTAPLARKKASETLAAITLGADPAAEKREAKAAKAAPAPVTLREFITGPYADWARANLKAHKRTLERLNFGFAGLLDRPLAELSQFDFERNRMARLKGTDGKKPKPATVNRDQAHLRAALGKAVAWGHIPANPLDGVTRGKEDRNQTIRAISATEEAKIVDVFTARRAAMVKEWQAAARRGRRAVPPVPRYLSFLEPAFTLSLHSGIRRGELLALLWADVNFEAGNIIIRGEGAKSSQSRVVPLSESARYTLATWQSQTQGRGFVFPKLSAITLSRAWWALLKEAGIKGVRWHDLRHSFGSRAALAGVPLDVLRKLMGHASLTTTARYLHHTDADARAAIQRMEAGR